MPNVLILGASHSGVAAAVALRNAGYDGGLTMVTQETVLPYHRPPLSKDGLTKDDYSPTPLRPASFYRNSGIDLKQGVLISSIDLAGFHAISSAGQVYPYETMILACGAEPRRLPVQIDPGGVALYLRTQDDFSSLKLRLANAKSITVIGGGLIGMEIAAISIQKGLRTTVIEAGSRLMERTLSKSVGSYVLDRHQAKGLAVRLDATVVNVHHDDTRGVDIVTLASGETIEADLVIAAIGATPNDALARDASVKTDNGILASENGLTSSPEIYAIGDCAAWYNPLIGRHVRNEAVNPSQDQAKIVAAAITGSEPPVKRLSRYWSHQVTIQIQMSGDINGADMEAVLKAPASGAFSVLGFKSGHLVAVQTINAAQQFSELQDMIGMDRDALATALDVEFPPPHHH